MTRCWRDLRENLHVKSFFPVNRKKEVCDRKRSIPNAKAKLIQILAGQAWDTHKGHFPIGIEGFGPQTALYMYIAILVQYGIHLGIFFAVRILFPCWNTFSC